MAGDPLDLEVEAPGVAEVVGGDESPVDPGPGGLLSGRVADVFTPDDLRDQAPLDEPVTERQVRNFWATMGKGLAALLADPRIEDHWRFSDDELDDLEAASTHLINRVPILRRAVHQSDYLTIAVTLGGYVTRNLADGAAVRIEEEATRGQHRQVGTDQGPAGPGPGGDGGGGDGRVAAVRPTAGGVPPPPL